MLDPSRPSNDDSRLAVDTLRGVAIVLVVALHATASLELPRLSTFDSPYQYFGYSLSFIRLPLFTVLSGFVYGLRPVRAETRRRFWRGKLRRLGLPLLTVTMAMFGLRALLGRGPDGLGDLLLAFLMPYEHLWYLPALAWIFGLVTVLEARRWLEAPRAWAGVLTVALAVHLGTDAMGWAGLQVLSLAGALYLLPSFLLGLGLSRFSSWLDRRVVVAGAAAVMVAGLTVQQLVFFEVIVFDVSKSGPLSVAVGLSACVVLFRFAPAIPALARLGRQSYPIYLLHGMGIAFGARVVAGLGAGSEHVSFFVQLGCGLVLPLVGAMLVRRIPWGRTVILGERAVAPPAWGLGRVVSSWARRLGSPSAKDMDPTGVLVGSGGVQAPTNAWGRGEPSLGGPLVPGAYGWSARAEPSPLVRSLRGAQRPAEVGRQR